MVNPSVFDAVSFEPNLFEISSGGFYFFLELVRFLFLLYVFVALIVFKIIGKKGINRACRSQTFVTLLGDFMIIGLCIYNFVLLLMISTKKKSTILKSDTFSNMVTKADRYNNLAIVEAIIISILLRKIIGVFQINNTNRIITKSISSALLQIIAYMLVILPLFIGFAVIGMGIWGSDLPAYRDFNSAFLSVLFMTMGQTDSTNLMRVSEFWTVLYTSVFFLIVIYLFVCSFIAIYSDTYRQTLLTEGYPTSKDRWGY